jgi:hypothetical protein
MPKIKNIFSRGIVDKDSDERFTSPEVLIDAENFLVTTSEGNNRGVGKNPPGNVKTTNYNIVGAKTIGVGKDESKEKIYNFIKGTNHDYVIEYDITTNTSEVVLQDVTNGVLNFKEGERIINVDIISSGEVDGDLLCWSGDSNPPRIVNIARAKTWAIGGFTEDEISVMKPSPIFAPSINITTSLDGVENNFIKDKFICFAYRYKYSDGFYSAPGSWSRIAFEPNRFSLDFQTYENKGMLNLSNAADITFNVGPRDVVDVELLFRESDNSTIYTIESFNKQKEGWIDNSNQVFQFSKSKISKVLPEDQFFRNFDNVPLSTKAQTPIGNRLAYANYVEGRNIDVDIDFDVTYESEDPVLDDVIPTINNKVNLVDYSNKSDFERKEEVGGSNPINQMNFLTNEVEVDLAVTGSPDTARFNIQITPKGAFSSVVYSVYIKEGATTVGSVVDVSGNQTINYNRTTNGNISFFVVSDEGLIYDLKLNYKLTNTVFVRSEYDYFADHQLSFPKSTGYNLSTLVGDTVIDNIAQYDMTDFDFVSGNQIRINFELQSSLVQTIQPSVTFFYNLTSDYTNLTDFFTNSDFKDILENAFSENFRLNEISNEGSLVSYQGFLVTQSGSNLLIQTPYVVYSVTEPSTATENKNEFFLINEADLVLVSDASFASLHSNRDYEVCQIYLDDKGRKTTGLVSKNNTVYIPADSSTKINRLKVSLNHNPPSWAKYYKFGVKQVKKQYQTIFGNQVYKDGIYRWIKLVGENKNKVKEGDLLILKSDYSGPLDEVQKIKVLEVSTQERDFIEDNKLATGKDLIEESGLYMKIKQGPFNINIDDNTFRTFQGFGKRRYASRSFVSTTPIFGEINESNDFEPYEVKAGTQINFEVVISAQGAIAFRHVFNVQTFAQEDYDSVKEWWDAEISVLDSWTNYENDYLKDFQWEPDGSVFRVKPWRDGTASRDISTRVTFDVNFSGGILVFETEPIEMLNDSFFETPNVYTITDGMHQDSEHVLNDAFNCFSFGNGVESFKMEDSFIGKTFSIDSNPTAVDEEGYKEINRFADITYSGIFNANSNVNRLNEFNLSLGNFKDDIEKVYGPIIKIKGQDTNLEVYQEDKCSRVFYGKDLLFNADGTSNLSRIEDVLGQQQTDGGEYGISHHPDSFDEFGFNSYFTDVKRGVVLKKNYNNGLFEASSQLMRSYFKNLFRNNTINHINGKYDQFNDFYILNIQYNNTEYVTWVYSDSNDGWLGRLKFNPEDMIRINNHFVTFKNGEIYLHNQEDVRNTFYGVESPSEFSFYFSQEPSTRKNFKNIEIEGSTAVAVELFTDLNQGYINQSDFEKKEGVFYAYIRNENDTIDSSLLSCQGIGNATISGVTLNFGFELDSIISIGDQVRNTNLELVGTIVSKTTNSLTLNAVDNLISGDFVLCSKPQSIANNDLLGYYMKVTCRFSSNTYQEIFAINSEVSKSFS